VIPAKAVSEMEPVDGYMVQRNLQSPPPWNIKLAISLHWSCTPHSHTCNLVCLSRPPWHFSIQELIDQVRTSSIWPWTKKLLNFVFALWYLQNLSTPFWASRQDSDHIKENIFNPSLPKNQRYRLVQCQAITYTTQTPDCSFQLKWKMTTRFLCISKIDTRKYEPQHTLEIPFQAHTFISHN
jgi:hypothetical protein